MNHHRDRARDYIDQMLDAARTIQEFVAGMSEEQFLADRKTRQAVERNISNLGEAANQLMEVLPTAATLFPDLELREMYATRNRFVHGYAYMNYVLVYEIAIKDIPRTIRALQSTLANWPSDLT
jgi:uncharacterized protein with HEPN domain